MYKLNYNQSISISIIRICSTISIVLCHLFQSLEINLAWWLNIGVQIFLFMSGFLSSYSQEKGFKFLQKKLTRIYASYWIFLIIVLPFYFFVQDISIYQIIIYFFGLQGFFINYRINGLGHLWFITVIVLSYLIASVFQSYKEKIINLKKIYFILILILIFFILKFIFLSKFYVPWVYTFILGYFLALKFNFNFTKKLSDGFTFIILILFLLRLGIENNLIKTFSIFDYDIITLSKMLTGCGIFITLYYYLSKSSFSKSSLVNNLELYSYEIYLTHHIFILGYFSLVNTSNFLILNIFIIFILTYILSVFIFKINKFIRKIINIKSIFKLLKYKKSLYQT